MRSGGLARALAAPTLPADGSHPAVGRAPDTSTAKTVTSSGEPTMSTSTVAIEPRKRHTDPNITYREPEVVHRELAEAADPNETHFPLSADSDAARAGWLAERLGRRVLFNHSTDKWHVFSDKNGIWLPDRDNTVEGLVVKEGREQLLYLATANMPERVRIARMKAARKLLDVGTIKKALEALSWRDEYKTVGDDWDTDPYLLGTPNGVVDLRTGKRLPPDPASRVSMSTGVKLKDYLTIEEAIGAAPRFMRFLAEVTSGDAELATFYLRWFGYSLFGHTLATKFLILSGKLGFNGKGAMKRLMLHVMKDYAVELDQGFYARNRWSPGANEARADLMKLKGKRAAFISEPTGEFNTEMLKNHTGGDQITARALHSNDVQSWQASHTITFLTNDIPPVADVGLAVADRVLVADFREHFTGSDPSQPGYKDERLDDALRDEAEAVLRILVHEAVKWHEALLRGEKGLEPIPARITAASKSYMDSNDAVGPFIEDACALDDDAQVAPKALHDHYMEWFAGQEAEGDPLSLNKFGEAIGRKFTKRGKPATWRGIRPLDAMALAERAA